MKKLYLALAVSQIAITVFCQGSYNGKLGYGLSPLGHPYDYSKFDTFLIEVANTCDGGIAFANDGWRDSYARSGIIPELQKIISLAQPVYGYTGMINFVWRSGDSLDLRIPGNNINNWSNDSTKALFLKMLINAADTLKPAYMFIGNETSHYWEMDSADYLNWVDFYHKAYDSVKAHSPATKVGTVFNYEHLSGQGELTGFTKSYWQSFDAHDTSRIDILGLTVYPFFHDSTADEIPDNYLDPIFTRLAGKPLAITETGWPAESYIGPWTCSPGQQVDYVNKLFNMIDGRNVEAVNWLFLHYLKDTVDSDAEKIFRSVSLRDSIGNDRPALSVWLSGCESSSSFIKEHSDNAPAPLFVFPNPAKSDFTIRLSNDGIYRFTIYNTCGQVLRKSVISVTNEIIMQRGDLASGIYFCTVESIKGEIYIGKLILGSRK